MNPKVLKMFYQEWSVLKAQVAHLEDQIRWVSLRERAEVAGAEAAYDTVGDLPTGFLGARATVADDGSGNPAPYWHDGTSWRKVTFS